MHYEGWVDSQGTPSVFGRIVDSATKETLLSGQVANGIFDGWCSSSEVSFRGIMKWSDESKTVTPVGWGRCDYPFTYVSDQSREGLVISEEQNYYVMEQGSQLSKQIALDTYKKLLYDNNKQYIKSVCTKKGLKYVEDVKMGRFIYTGGWKDGQPYLYGAYKDHPDTYYPSKVVFCGYFNYEPENITFSVNDKGSWTEYRHVTRDPFVFRQHTISFDSATSKQIIKDVEINFDHYTTFISDSKQNVLEFEVLNFQDGLYSKAKSLGNKDYWGIIVARNDLYEGMIFSSNGTATSIYPGEYGKFISNKGDIKDATIEKGSETVFIKFVNGDTFLQEQIPARGYLLGDYTFADGSYIVGLFRKPSAWYNNQDYEPVYAEAYDKNGEIIKSYVDTPWGIKANEIEEHILRLKTAHQKPISGYGVAVVDNGKYEGEFYVRRYHGKGRLTNNDGTYYDGIWEKGNFVSGTGHYTTDAGEYTGEMKGHSPHGKGKFTYNDGTYYDGLWTDGKFVSGTGHYKTTTGEYTGEIKGDSPHGKGKYTDNDGSYYDGVWEDELFMAGDGYIVYDDGTSFRGTYELSYAKQGTFTTPDGTKVTQTWDVDEDGSMLDDHVDIIYPNGAEYHGPCETLGSGADLREFSLEGDSVVILDSVGNRYTGGWGPLGRKGHGVDVFANGDMLSTVWEYDEFVQDAVLKYTWSDGRKFEGTVGKKGKIGKGSYFNADGSEASKKEYKEWVMQVPTTIDIHFNPVKRRIP